MKREFEKEATIVLYECDNFLGNMNDGRDIIMEIAERAQLKAKTYWKYQHEGGAKTVVAVVEESFVVIDEWPEYKTVIIRIASCNPNSNFEEVKKYVKERFGCREISYYERVIPLYLTK